MIRHRRRKWGIKRILGRLAGLIVGLCWGQFNLAQAQDEKECYICIQYQQECHLVDRRQACVDVCAKKKRIACKGRFSIPGNSGGGGVRG